MADLTDYLQRLRPPKPSTFENYSTTTTDFSSYTFFAHQQPEFPTGYSHQKINGAYHPEIFSAAPIVHTLAHRQNVNPERNSTKEMEQSSSRSKSISPAASTSTSTKKRNSSGRCKKGNNKEMDKIEEVVHVRAKRGQATDSHSIAERVRREKINSKLRCLQEIVPGCHKSMGIAVMLEEIINYVHSLQNQVEFLSMELAAASSSHVLNVDTLSSRRAQETNSPEAQELQKWPRERHGELGSCHYTTWSI